MQGLYCKKSLFLMCNSNRFDVAFLLSIVHIWEMFRHPGNVFVSREFHDSCFCFDKIFSALPRKQLLRATDCSPFFFLFLRCIFWKCTFLLFFYRTKFLSIFPHMICNLLLRSTDCFQNSKYRIIISGYQSTSSLTDKPILWGSTAKYIESFSPIWHDIRF